jgi:hypothetical protein
MESMSDRETRKFETACFVLEGSWVRGGKYEVFVEVGDFAALLALTGVGVCDLYGGLGGLLGRFLCGVGLIATLEDRIEVHLRLHPFKKLIILIPSYQQITQRKILLLSTYISSLASHSNPPTLPSSPTAYIFFSLSVNLGPISCIATLVNSSLKIYL